MRKLLALLIVVILNVSFTSTIGAADTTGTVTTFAAGNGVGTDGNQANGPRGVSFDDADTLYISDTDNHRVQRVTFDGGGTATYTTVGGTGGQGQDPTELYSPANVVASPDGSIFVLDTWNHRIQRITFDGNGDPNPATKIYGITAGYGSSVNNFAVPSGLAVDAEGSLFVSDRDNYRVQKISFDSNGDAELAVTVAGGNGRGDAADELDAPYGIAFDADGALYIADSENDRIQKVTFDSNGDPELATTVAGGNGPGTASNQLDTPFGVAVRVDGTIYISDSANHRVQELTFDSNGAPQTPTTVAGGNGPGSLNNQLDTPYDLAFDSDRSLYIADSANHRVQKLVLSSLDAVAPSIVLSTPAPNTVGGSLTVTFSCADTGGADIDTCTATLNGQPVQNGDIVTSSFRGTQTLVVTAVDNAGNTSTQATAFFAYGKREVVGTADQLTGARGAIARLYMAAFVRAPEPAGSDYWTTRRNAGMSLQAIAGHFATGPEFKSKYETVSDADFVDQMYLSVLDRTAEPAGRGYWIARLAGGLNRTDLLLLFSDSPEFRSITYTS